MAALRKEVHEGKLLAEMNASKESSLQTALGLMRDETEGAGKTVRELEARAYPNPNPNPNPNPTGAP